MSQMYEKSVIYATYLWYENRIEDIQCFDVEYGIYFMSETGFFIFSRVRSSSQNTLETQSI